MPTTLLPVPHKQQEQDADCLAACAKMALDYIGYSVAYRHLLKRLDVKPFGTPGRNLKNLTTLGVQVTYREGSLAEIKSYLQNNIPCIVLVRTADLAYWSYSTDHAVVVVGFDNTSIYVNDPAFETHPHIIPETEFELAWMLFDYRYGIITG